MPIKFASGLGVTLRRFSQVKIEDAAYERSIQQAKWKSGGRSMPLWQRLLITLAVILVTNFIAGLLWSGMLNAEIPGYLSGVVGGISAVLAWEFLKWVGMGPKAQP